MRLKKLSFSSVFLTATLAVEGAGAGLVFFSSAIVSSFPLLGFLMHRVLAAEPAILLQLKFVRGIFLVLEGIVVPLLALAAA
jgi:hypothetical protein